MNSEEIFQAVEQVAAAKGKQKELLLKDLLEDEDFRSVVVAAYDPFVTYGISQTHPVPDHDHGLDMFDEWSCDLLEALSSRELSGGMARDEVYREMRNLKKNSAELLRRVLTKDLRAGFTSGTVNRARPGTIRVFDCMLAHKYEPRHVKAFPVYVETKLDGVRLLAIVDPHAREVDIVSRNGKPFTTVNHLKQRLLNMLPVTHGKYVFDGEILSGSFNDTVGNVRRKDQQADDAVFHVFHAMPWEEFEKGIDSRPLERSREELEELFEGWHHRESPIRLVDTTMVFSHEEIQEQFDAVFNAGGEGIIIKDPDSFYVCKRSRGWLKVKGEETIDAPITGIFEGEGKYAGVMGGLIVDVDGVDVRVGGGFSDQQRQNYWHDTTLFGKMVEIKYHEKTPDGSLRHPRFVKLRPDKDL